ncbi:histidine phosphatase family protein [Pseudomonas stutzeri]|nr:histidine phosphatase family protein [Stutzerimonas stutzeri]
MHITLARHGRPDLHLDSWLAPMAMSEWLDHYDRAGVVDESVPTATLAQAAAARLLVSSPLPRCVQSAERLAPGREVLCEAVFCEAELPCPHGFSPRLPPRAWEALFRLAWFYGLTALARPRPATERRAREAAQRLIRLAHAHDSVFLVGHGLMILLIARELRALGWQGPPRPISRYWQCSVYRAAD